MHYTRHFYACASEHFNDISAACAYLDINNPPQPLPPNKWVRFAANTDRGKKKSAEAFSFSTPNGDGVNLINWKTGQRATVWTSSKQSPRLSRRQALISQKEGRARIEALQRQEDRLKRQTAQLAQDIYDSLCSEAQTHEYLKAKHLDGFLSGQSFKTISSMAAEHAVNEFREKLGLDPQRFSGMWERLLVIPMTDAAGKIQSLQFISPSGRKTFLKGGAKKAALAQPFVRGVFPAYPASETIGIAEGFATAASVSRLYGIPCFCAFDAGNLAPVTETLLKKYPNAAIRIYGDRDPKSETGQTRALEAVRLIPLARRGGLYLPEFTEQDLALFQDLYGKAPTDFNDFAIVRGLI